MMNLGVRCLGLVAILFAIFFQIDATRSQGSTTYHPSFSLYVTGNSFPILNGATDLRDGTVLFILVGKPWLPDAAQRLARGLAACGDNCFAATTPDGLTGATVTVRNGSFSAGPFSFNGEPFKPGTYPVDISLSVDLKAATPGAIRAMGTPLYKSTIRVTP